MVALPIPRRVTVAPTPTIAILAAALVALGCLFMPSDVLEIIVLDSGIPAILPAAEPPLGYTARVALAITAGGAAGALAWASAFVLLGGDRIVALTLPRLPARRPGLTRSDPVPVLRRADAHPDAPARAPLVATRDLGAPFLDVRATPPKPPVERDLPRDLDAPLSAFDPAAIPDAPAEPARAVPPLQPRKILSDLDPGERIDAFELPRPVPTQPHDGPIAAPRTDATIHALLDRLERGVTARRTAPAEPQRPSIATTLDELRGLATR